MLIMGASFCWCTTGFCIWSFILFNLHKWFIKDISSTNKVFADNTSTFSIINDIDVSEHELNSDLNKISMWAYQWKMSFNPDFSKQDQEVIFSKKTQRLFNSTVLFNNILVQRSTRCFCLDEKLNFNTHITEKIAEASKGIGIITKQFKSLPRNAFVTIYKLFIRST